MVGIENSYSENPNVKIITNLDDIGQPRTCEQWGDRFLDFDEVIPLITDDGPQNILWDWFNTGGAFPSTAYIDHTMTVYYKANNPSFGPAISTIDSMLDECGDLCNNFIQGDLNQDDIVNIIDIILVIDYILDDTYNESADLNDDGTNNILDILILVDIIIANEN